MAKIVLKKDGFNRYRGQEIVRNDVAEPLRKEAAEDIVRNIGRYAINWNPPEPIRRQGEVDPFDDMPVTPAKKPSQNKQDYFRIDGDKMIANLDDKPAIVKDILQKMEAIVVNDNIYSNMNVMKAFNEMYIVIKFLSDNVPKNTSYDLLKKIGNAKALADQILY